MQLPTNDLENFFEAFEKLHKTGSLHHSGETYYIKNATKYAFLMKKWDDNPKHDHIMIKVDKKTGDIFTPNGKVSIGNLNSEFKGLETFDKTGPIYHNHQDRKEARIRQLKGLPEVEKIEPPKENYDYGF